MKFILVPFQILALSLRYPGSFSEKVVVFRTLFSLKFKKFFSSARNSECRQMILNYSVTGYDLETLHTLFYDIFLSPPYFFKSKNERPLIIDCGAHIGMSVLYFKKLYPNSSIIAVEANPHSFGLLEKNITVNNLKNVTTYNVVLGTQKGKVPFYLPGNLGSINASVRKGPGSETEISADSIPLSELISGYKEKIDLVKLDVEGAEVDIISDLATSGALSIPEQYIIEYHHRTNSDRSALANFLKKFEDAGYNYNLWSRSQIGTCQDILIHCYKDKG